MADGVLRQAAGVRGRVCTEQKRR